MKIKSSYGHIIPSTYVNIEKSPSRICLLLHGLFTDKDEKGRFTRLAKKLQDHNISSIRIDLSGHGKNPIDSKSTSIARMIGDIFDTIKMLHENGIKQIDVIASSFSGALLSVLLATKPSLKINSIVYLNPVLDFNSVFIHAECFEMAEIFTTENINHAWTKGYFEPVDGFNMSREFIIDLSSINVPVAYNSISKPHLVIHGTKDELVSFSTAKDIVSKNAAAKWLEIEGAVHAFMDTNHENLAHHKTIEWILAS